VNDAELAVRLRTTLGRLGRRIRQYAPQSLTAGQISTLAGLEAIGPVRLGDLADYEGVSAPTQSRIVASLQAHNLIDRTPDPDDGRAFLLAISSQGAARLSHLREERSAFLTERIAALPPEHREALLAALPALEALAEP
jgi:DNA-binding MarR family transcriptional regulator